MNIQSLSIVVPNKKCINDCKFCVSKMHTNDYPDFMDINYPDLSHSVREYIERLNFARENGCNTVILTGQLEPQQNKHFLYQFALLNRLLKNPFHWIEIQTTGRLLDYSYLRFLKEFVGIKTLAISLTSFSMLENMNILGIEKGNILDVRKVCKEAKELGFIIRICLNLNSNFNFGKPWDLIRVSKEEFGADQITFRKLYASGDSKEANWIQENKYEEWRQENLRTYIETNGTILGKLPFGATKYLIDGVSVVLDNDCMQKELKEPDTYKYLILRPDCRLYTSWDEKGSVLF